MKVIACQESSHRALLTVTLKADTDSVSDRPKLLLGQNVTVTGGAGFIGSHLCEALGGLGKEVTILDNLSSGTRENVHRVKEHASSVKLIVGDCKNPRAVRRAVAKADVVRHFRKP